MRRKSALAFAARGMNSLSLGAASLGHGAQPAARTGARSQPDRGQLSAIRENVANTQAVVGLIGDSLTSGVGGIGATIPGYTVSLSYYLWGRYGCAGSGWVSTGASNLVTFNIAPPGTSVSYTNSWTIEHNGGTGGMDPTYGPDDAAAWISSNGATVTFQCGTTSTLPCDRMVLYFGKAPMGGAAGAFDCQVDTGHSAGACTTGISTANSSALWVLGTLDTLPPWFTSMGLILNCA